MADKDIKGKIKKDLIKLGFVEEKVCQAWLDVMDIDPNPNNPADWQTLYKHDGVYKYVNLNFYPNVYIENCHNTDRIGRYVVKEKTKPKEVIEYIKSILDL